MHDVDLSVIKTMGTFVFEMLGTFMQRGINFFVPFNAAHKHYESSSAEEIYIWTQIPFSIMFDVREFHVWDLFTSNDSKNVTVFV